MNLENAGLGEVEVRVEASGYRGVTKRFTLEANRWTQAMLELPVIPPSEPPAPPLQEPRPSPPVQPPGPSGGGDTGEMVHVSDFGFYIDKYEVTNA
ncbi:MAG: hypothetical protein A3F84_14695 [Candidatus Handelsmanbacteria bacterium RIFCSPLOWO2_12_FULL_64_10]|uniref:Uncharacterized protein n=1 Tax=Handelsmanbacteria sp. (strain RIFCSPLOWO2_12_FULL_64_10) TaxID=1817868 RepID=A0A1F6CHI3_HANXR|nr:MAG: hypothetical protein A3F84_14695 [Candidatus Handelsmanbacteria bacterium RIFCSPLOWO2_12_FULL_64_10]